MKKILSRIKKSYLLIILITGIIVTSLIGTYAMFSGSKVSTNNVISLTTPEVVNVDLTCINEYKKITIDPKEYKVIKFNISNSLDSSLYYGVWYEMLEPSVKSDKHIIARLKSYSTPSVGSLGGSANISVYILVQNKDTNPLTINIGVASNSTNTLGLPTSRILITEEASISKGDFSFVATGIDFTSGKKYILKDNYICDKTNTVVTYDSNTRKLTYSQPDNCALEFAELNIVPILNVVKQGDYINYIVGESCSSTSKWRVAYTDSTNVYIISAGAVGGSSTSSQQAIQANQMYTAAVSAMQSAVSNCYVSTYADSSYNFDSSAFKKITSEMNGNNGKTLAECFNVESSECGINNDLLNSGTYLFYEFYIGSSFYSSSSGVVGVHQFGCYFIAPIYTCIIPGTRPIYRLKSTVMITGGSGTKDDPYNISV